MDMIENDKKYIYKKADFLKLGVAEGSFRKLMQNLELNSPEFCTFKITPENHNRKTLYYTEEAYQKVLQYLRDREKSKNKNELLLAKANTELKQENQNLKNTLALLESRYTKENTELQIKLKDMELEREKEKNNFLMEYNDLKEELNMVKSNWSSSAELNAELGKQNDNLKKEIERLKNRGFRGFINKLFNKDKKEEEM